jgi:hypothetical protein
MGELTASQSVRLATLPEGYTVVGEKEGAPLLERPDGRLVRLQPNGRLATAKLVARVQSYLSVERC